MNDQPAPLPSSRKIAISVIAAGAIGGFLSWLYSITVGDPFHENGLVAFVAALPLGMGAGFVGVYLLANSDTRALPRTLALALLCGLFWKPVYEAGREHIFTSIQDGRVAETAEALDEQIASMREATGPELRLKIGAVESSTNELLEKSMIVRDPRLRTRIDALVNESVIAIDEVADQAPEESAQALGRIGSAGAVFGRPEVARSAAKSISELPDRTVLNPEATAEASNSLNRIAGAEAIGGRHAEATQAHRRSVQILQEGERTFKLHADDLRRLEERSILRDVRPGPIPPPP